MKPALFRNLVLAAMTLICCGAWAAPLPSSAENPEAQYRLVLQLYHSTLSSGDKRQKLENIDHCIAMLRQVLPKDTKGKIADKCYYLLGQCYHSRYDLTQGREDFAAAVENYRLVVQKCPRSPLADDAQYMTGVIYLNQDLGQAYVEFCKVGILFPNGDMKQKAADMAAKTQKRLPPGERKKTAQAAPPGEPPPPAVHAGDASAKPGAAPAPVRSSVAGTPKAGPVKAKRTARARESVPSLARQLALEVRRIVIDPGHGGKDTGAISADHICEKQITLEVARELKRILEQKTGCEVILTRSDDRSMSLEERTAFANSHKADLFVSIHTNAHEDRSRHGTETYFLDLSRDQESARVAAFENATANKKISDLEAILHDLMLNTKVNESSRLAREVQTNMVKKLCPTYGQIRDLGIKQAPFYVLLGAEMPCILIETAFLTNDREEHLLRDRGFQKNLALGISNGIESYIRKMRDFAHGGGRS